MDILQACRDIVAEHQARELGDTLVDVQTANAIVTVWEGLNEANRAKFAGMKDPAAMGLLAWRVLDKAGAR